MIYHEAITVLKRYESLTILEMLYISINRYKLIVSYVSEKTMADTAN